MRGTTSKINDGRCPTLEYRRQGLLALQMHEAVFHTAIVPSFATTVNLLCIGKGGRGNAATHGGGGGALTYENYVPVQAGDVFSFIVADDYVGISGANKTIMAYNGSSSGAGGAASDTGNSSMGGAGGVGLASGGGAAAGYDEVGASGGTTSTKGANGKSTNQTGGGGGGGGGGAVGFKGGHGGGTAFMNWPYFLPGMYGKGGDGSLNGQGKKRW